jgi:hypothetical protein
MEGLRDNFRKKLKWISLDQEAVLHRRRLWWVHFKALQFLRDVMEPGKTSGNIAFTPICSAEQQESQDEETINFGENQECKVESAFSEDATSEIQDPALTAHLKAPKRKRRKLTLSYQEEMISLENRKLKWLIKQEEENDEELNFFRSLVQNMKQLPPTK